MSEKNPGWIGVDLDGTLAQYTTFQGAHHIGDPVPAMLDRVKAWVTAGREVRIMTARAYDDGRENIEIVKAFIDNWSLKHIGQKLPITCTKDKDMLELWDDRAVQVIKNTGLRADGQP